ncbi:Chlorophyll synthase [Morus notabilis]|uniref:Chlorophyll synthase n=1 Tax=Morus notabilis TaxID=981085 RepID=W9SCK2_9ROSA|nr:Chlorophyll synthase [Morus notabilis]
MASVLNTVPSLRLSNINTSRVRPRPIATPLSVSFTMKSKAPAGNGSSFNQLLGIKGAAQETNKWKIRLQLTKPVTWPPLIWGVVCGAAASGNFHWTPEDVAKSIVCMMMSGPFLTGYTQTINDWYDREIDAINEPYRPIPSGAISENEVITQIWVLLLGGIGLAGLLDVWVSGLNNRWAGQALFGTLTPDIVVLTLLYSIAGLGIAIVNDFKSVEGDRALGLQSLPVAFGAETAKWICVGAIDITQLSVAEETNFIDYLGKGREEELSSPNQTQKYNEVYDRKRSSSFSIKQE